MKVVIDIECNALVNPTKIWCIVCKQLPEDGSDIDTGKLYVFRNILDDREQLKLFHEFVHSVDLWIAHNGLDYDFPVLNSLVGINLYEDIRKTLDTLILSKLVDYSRKGHSIEAYGIEFGLEKGKNSTPDFFKKWSQELEDYCVRDVEITHRIYRKYLHCINDIQWHPAIELEHSFQLVVNQLHRNGFSFNVKRATGLLDKVTAELDVLNKEILDAYPARLKLVREIHPRLTKHGTLSRTDFRWHIGGDLSEYNGGAFCRCAWQEFNPSSHKQLIEVLHSAGWKPSERTKTYIDTEREINRAKYSKEVTKKVDLENLSVKLVGLEKFGWKINEENLASLPPTAPPPARLLAKRILLESRRRTLTEWLGLVDGDDGRIHGKFYGIGAWTHRMAHQQPNTANIPNEFDTSGKRKLLGKELRSCWQAPRNRLLAGVDAEGIQLRIFAHYIDDKEFTDALVRGRKDDKTDPHSLNQRILGPVCKTRQAAKRFVYALLLGGGISKLAQILETSKHEAQDALDRLMGRYQGFTYLKKHIIPTDGRRGWFVGLDGRRVRIPGETASERSHLCMSGYLQNGEAIVMKRATLRWEAQLPSLNSLLVNLVHDEWQTETPNNMEIAIKVAKMQADSLKIVGEELCLKCPLAGSYWNDDHHDYTIGTNWSVTH